jgi:hypothetical protein
MRVSDGEAEQVELQYRNSQYFPPWTTADSSNINKVSKSLMTGRAEERICGAYRTFFDLHQYVCPEIIRLNETGIQKQIQAPPFPIVAVSAG